MKIKFYLFTLISSLLVLVTCGSGKETHGGEITSQVQRAVLSSGRTESESAFRQAFSEPERAKLLGTLDEIAELERAGSWFQGLALTESAIREKAGDYAGAVAAAYKELAWAYGLGLIKKEEIEQGLRNVLAANDEENTEMCANAILAFINERWDDASSGFNRLFAEADEPDGIGRWMNLVCAMEKNNSSAETDYRRLGEAYKSIRARYAHFPEYWYRGARIFSDAIAAQYAENCINISPLGPFAGECRSILASYTGLKNEDGIFIKTKMEVEHIISQSVNSGDPELLSSLIPLIGLPDNPYTVFAVGALRSLTNVPKYRDYFTILASSSKGRLAERFSYICRG